MMLAPLARQLTQSTIHKAAMIDLAAVDLAAGIPDLLLDCLPPINEDKSTTMKRVHWHPQGITEARYFNIDERSPSFPKGRYLKGAPISTIAAGDRDAAQPFTIPTIEESAVSSPMIDDTIYEKETRYAKALPLCCAIPRGYAGRPFSYADALKKNIENDKENLKNEARPVPLAPLEWKEVAPPIDWVRDPHNTPEQPPFMSLYETSEPLPINEPLPMPAIHCKAPKISVEAIEKFRQEILSLSEELY